LPLKIANLYRVFPTSTVRFISLQRRQKYIVISTAKNKKGIELILSQKRGQKNKNA